MSIGFLPAFIPNNKPFPEKMRFQTARFSIPWWKQSIQAYGMPSRNKTKKTDSAKM
jgi:hypothetical protein